MLRLRDDFDAEVNLRVVLPITVRSQVALFDPSNMNPRSQALIIKRRLNVISRRWTRQVIGPCRLWWSRGNPFSGKIVWRRYDGDWSKWGLTRA